MVRRFKRHMLNAFSINEKSSKDCSIFYDAIREFGKENFKYEVLQVINDDVNIYDVE